jgi:glucose-1-phosphate thymidylyltransferase
MLAGIREILIISTPDDLPNFSKLLGDGNSLGCRFEYAEQAEPKGLAQAFTIGADFIEDDKVCLILGDNIFYGAELQTRLQSSTDPDGGIIFAYPVKDPERYGVVEFGEDNRVISIEEKPDRPKSHYAVPGIYFYDNMVVNISQNLKPSTRGEFEITDVNNAYLIQNKLKVKVLGRGTAWLDTGTHQSLLQASEFVRVIEERQGFKIGCIEEVAYRMDFINDDQLSELIKPMMRSGYGLYLQELISTYRK